MKDQGASPALVGAIVAAYFIAGLFCQIPAGRAVDHFGPRRILLIGQGLYAASTLAFVATSTPTAALAFRFTQGLGAGMAEVAALSIVGVAVAPERRGRAFSTIYGGQLSGTIIGPLVGTVFGLAHMQALFIATTVLAAASSIPVFFHPELKNIPRRDRTVALTKLNLQPGAKGAIMLAAAFGLVIGTYDASWSLLLDSRGASGAIINLSWVLFSLPFVLMTKPAGWMVDHLDRRVLALSGLAIEVLMCSLYPFIHSIAIILGLATFEACALAVALPSGQSLMTEEIADDGHGRVQGLYATAQLSAMTLAATVAGYLFTKAPWAPFVAMAGASALVGVAIAATWRHTKGRVGTRT
jgi:DHA1 family multidrug resistance protein-like MFS transporter